MSNRMIREALAPSIATSGMMHYWKGNYQKAFARLEKAKRWSPGIFLDSEFQGYYGLSLDRIGETKKSLEHVNNFCTGFYPFFSRDFLFSLDKNDNRKYWSSNKEKIQ